MNCTAQSYSVLDLMKMTALKPCFVFSSAASNLNQEIMLGVLNVCVHCQYHGKLTDSSG